MSILVFLFDTDIHKDSAWHQIHHRTSFLDFQGSALAIKYPLNSLTPEKNVQRKGGLVQHLDSGTVQ